MEVLPCSRVAHIARVKKPYHSNIAYHTRRNALRVAEVWMDEYKSNVYLAWNIPMEVGELLMTFRVFLRPVRLWIKVQLRPCSCRTTGSIMETSPRGWL